MKPAEPYEGQPGWFGDEKGHFDKFGHLFRVRNELYIDFCDCNKYNYFKASGDPLDGGWFKNEGKPDIELDEGYMFEVYYSGITREIVGDKDVFIDWDIIEYWRLVQPIKWLGSE